MYLKNLTVLGFKSFADKTSLNFLPGVTAIVGPNGCGKSNISDAIRWVLGEQSARALRGSEMADVIFNGTDARKPLGMAEVSLTIGDVDKEQLKAAGIELEYNEVTITRRVFRDGGSEYFINRVPCRLRDIQQLFMGTGLGKSNYSVMAQGQITQILSSKPEDRRLIFEEAAGITRFKSQKKEALRKLEYTDQNLLRVSDLIKEVKRQIGSLQRQAGKARRYKQLSLELQHLETQYARHQYDVLNVEISNLCAKAKELDQEIEERTQEIARIEDEIAQLRAGASELERQIAESTARGIELKGEIERLQSRAQYNEEMLQELEQQNGRALAEIASGEERIRAAETELRILNDRIASSEENLKKQRQVLEERRLALEQVERELQSAQEKLRKAQSEAFAQAQKLSRMRNELVSLDTQRQGSLARVEKLRAESEQIKGERVNLEAKIAEYAQSVEAEKLEAVNRRESVQERQQRLQQIQELLKTAQSELDELIKQQTAQRSRLTVLEQLDRSYEGFSPATVAVLKQSKEVLGSLADKIRVPDKYVMAIESALGHNLQVVLTEQPETAQRILSELANNKKGRASIAALSLKPSNGNGYDFDAPLVLHDSQAEVSDSTQNQQAVEENGKVLALCVVEADKSVEHIIKGLLGNTYIVPDLQTATNCLQNGDAGRDFVTLNGELLNRFGIFTGGYANGNGSAAAPSSILGRKNQISALRERIDELQKKIDEVQNRKNQLLEEQRLLTASLQEAQKQLRECEMSIAQREGECKALQNSLKLLNQRLENIEFEMQTLEEDAAQSLRKRTEISLQISEIEQMEKAATDEIAVVSALIEELRTRRDSANSALTEAKVAVASEQQLYESLQRQIQPIQNRIRDFQQNIKQRKDEIERILARRNQYQNEIAESRQIVERLSHEREQVNNQTSQLIASKNLLDKEITGREDALRSCRAKLGELQQIRNNIEVELAQKRMAVQNIRERIQQKYQLNIEDVRSECITITIADDGPPKVETLTPEEMQMRGLATDWEAVANQIAALQKKIEEMGAVNLVAIEDYEAAEQRYEFLSQQYDDLVKAKDQLLEVINRINSQTRQMFMETFNKIRENFRTMFVEVFGGGKADLYLVDEGDVLESGIEIVARPPGKQLQSISLLSGGEQTMTAIALLFAIYQVKPSPFCLLDELDAPLDESNINRFIAILRRFIDRSQFIIITHNKRTIALADIIYGITMQERGVSKIVSVKFKREQEPQQPTQNIQDNKPQTQPVPDATAGTADGEPASTEVVMAK